MALSFTKVSTTLKIFSFCPLHCSNNCVLFNYCQVHGHFLFLFSGDNSNKLCDICIGRIPGERCTAADPYAGFEGAFKCLVEAGEVAFLKHTTITEMTATNLNFRELYFIDFTLDSFESVFSLYKKKSCLSSFFL